MKKTTFVRNIKAGFNSTTVFAVNQGGQMLAYKHNLIINY